MKRTLRRDRTDLWAWAYLAIFGTDGTDESDSDSTVASESDDERDEVPLSGG